MSRHRAARESEDAEGRRRLWVPAALCGLLALTVAWLVLPAEGSPLADNPGSLSGTAESDVTGSAGPNATTTWEPTTPDPEVDPPGAGPTEPAGVTAVSISIPSIRVDSALVPLSVDPSTGVLVPPERYDTAGVFTAGPVPGEIGPAIIAGHVDSRTGPGVFYRLEEMVAGQTISVLLSDGERVDFRVDGVASYPKTAFPTTEVYGPTPGRELRLITCGGGFDRSLSSYYDNIVVYAVRV